jgi:hypothetical protein
MSGASPMGQLMIGNHLRFEQCYLGFGRVTIENPSWEAGLREGNYATLGGHDRSCL